jgi:hypothetical protein
MGLGRRQIYRLRRAFSADGPAGLASRKRGQPSNRKHGETFRATVLSILKAIEAGAWSTTLQDRLAELEARKKTLRDELAASGVATEEMVIDLDGAKMYRKYVADLEATLNDDEVRTEAADLLRGLIDRVVLIPDPTAPDGLRGELNGAVAEILLLSDRVPGVLPLQAGRKKPRERWFPGVNCRWLRGAASVVVITSGLGDLRRPAARSRTAIISPRRMAFICPRFSPGVSTTSPTSERMSSRASPSESGSANVSARRMTLVR